MKRIENDRDDNKRIKEQNWKIENRNQEFDDLWENVQDINMESVETEYKIYTSCLWKYNFKILFWKISIFE